MVKSRGFLMASMLMLLPIALVITFSLAWNVVEDSGQAMLQQRRAKVFFVGQAGLASAFHLWSSNNYEGATHDPDGDDPIPTSSSDRLQLFGLPNYSVDANGWVQWSWTAGSPPSQSFTQTANREFFRFKVYNSAGTLWKVVCESEVDGLRGTQELGFSVENALDYTVLDNADSTDFSMAEDHNVAGKIHANGNLYLRPWKTDGLSLGPIPILKPTLGILHLDSTSITSGNRIIRRQDNLGNADPGGTVTIANSAGGLGPTLMEGEDQRGGGDIYDSMNSDWASSVLGKYAGVVADSEVGAQRRATAARRALEPGGFYDLKAGLHLDLTASAPYCHAVDFYNQAEEREVHVLEIDVQKMQEEGAVPANGVIYSRAPVRLVNAARIDQKITIASPATIYTKGDFNMDPDGSGPLSSQSAALVTTDRVYNLTDSFDDTKSYVYQNPLTDFTKATDGGGPEPNVLEINAAIVDGAPNRDVRAWREDSGHYVPGTFTNPFTGADTGVKRIPTANPLELRAAYPNSASYLENLQQVKIRYRGSRVHLRNARMARFDNSDALGDPTLTPWIAKSAYIPPDEKSYEHDSKLSQVGLEPPLAPRAARRLYWREVR